MTSAFEHSCPYGFTSELGSNPGGTEVQFATSGGAAEFPYFFQGAKLTGGGKTARLVKQLLQTR